MKPPSAETILAALAAGRMEGFDWLFDRLGEPLLRFAKGLLANASDAEDAVGDVFVSLMKNRRRLTQVRDLDAYVFAILRNAAYQQLQRRTAEKQHMLQLSLNAPANRPAHVSAGEETEQLNNALAQLPPDQREVVMLKIHGNLTFAQIAEILSINANTAAGRYRYAMEKLRAALKEHQ